MPELSIFFKVSVELAAKVPVAAVLGCLVSSGGKEGRSAPDRREQKRGEGRSRREEKGGAEERSAPDRREQSS